MNWLWSMLQLRTNLFLFDLILQTAAIVALCGSGAVAVLICRWRNPPLD
jgi:hypothetical protein